MVKILLDTNFLLYCIEQKIRFIEQIDEKMHSQYELIILDKVMNELKIISQRSNQKEKLAAKIALGLINSISSFKIVNGKGKNADDSLLLFDFKDIIIASVDKELRKRFKNACFLTIKHKKYLDFI